MFLKNKNIILKLEDQKLQTMQLKLGRSMLYNFREEECST